MPYPNDRPPTYLEFYNVLAKALDGEGTVPVEPVQARGCIKIIEVAVASSRRGFTLDFEVKY